MFDTWYKMNVLIESGIDISPVITHRLSCEEHERAFEILQTKESGKVMMSWS
jgi:threonine 3-dehydrogenase